MEHLETFLDDFELLKLEIRLFVDMKVLPIKKQAELSLLMDSIVTQITGWCKSQPCIMPELLPLRWQRASRFCLKKGIRRMLFCVVEMREPEYLPSTLWSYRKSCRENIKRI